jgi:tetrahydromethanopterin S-methyltransferase subunit G
MAPWGSLTIANRPPGKSCGPTRGRAQINRTLERRVDVLYVEVDQPVRGHIGRDLGRHLQRAEHSLAALLELVIGLVAAVARARRPVEHTLVDGRTLVTSRALSSAQLKAPGWSVMKVLGCMPWQPEMNAPDGS